MTDANSGNAWPAAPDPRSFALAVGALLADEREANRRARNALQTAANLSWESVTDHFSIFIPNWHSSVTEASIAGTRLRLPSTMAFLSADIYRNIADSKDL
jgi:hypothetical protein